MRPVTPQSQCNDVRHGDIRVQHVLFQVRLKGDEKTHSRLLVVVSPFDACSSDDTFLIIDKLLRNVMPIMRLWDVNVHLPAIVSQANVPFLSHHHAQIGTAVRGSPSLLLW